MWRVKPTLLLLLNNLGLLKDFKIRIKLCSSNDSLRSLNVYNSLPKHWISSVFPISNKAFCGAQGWEWRGRILVPHILQSQKPDPIEKIGHTIRSRCACVWNFLDGTRTFFYMTLFFILRYGLSFFFSFLFFLFLCFWVRILFLFLSHSPYSFCNM